MSIQTNMIAEVKAYAVAGRTVEKSIKAGWDMLADMIDAGDVTDAEIAEVIGTTTSWATAKRAVWRWMAPLRDSRKAENSYEAAVAA